MPSRIDTRRALAAIDEKRLLDLEQRSIRIPSSTFEEGALADLYADYMTHIGLDVEMQHIADRRSQLTLVRRSRNGARLPSMPFAAFAGRRGRAAGVRPPPAH